MMNEANHLRPVPGRPMTADPILIVDDDHVFRERLMLALRDRGYTVAGAANSVEAVDMLSTVQPARAVVDLRMPGESGLECVRRLTEHCPELTVIVLTGYGSIATAKEALRLGAADYLTKPADADEILAAFDGRSSDYVTDHAGDNVPSLARIEWEHIQRILADCNGNISQAARILGIHRRSLQRKLSKRPPLDD
jgi:two-component system response regulator RegA